MPATRAARLGADELPAVATAGEIADFERVDVRTLRADMEAGRVPGAYRRGRSWRVNVAVYLAAIENTHTNSTHESAGERLSAGVGQAPYACGLRGGD